ncbi:hypothetical protein C2E23DRAFT_233467 [Lenzites betulinus]|nr:hypothetical protein C2E23DRAFT_233467 [Lenzites betulinus]
MAGAGRESGKRRSAHPPVFEPPRSQAPPFSPHSLAHPAPALVLLSEGRPGSVSCAVCPRRSRVSRRPRARPSLEPRCLDLRRPGPPPLSPPSSRAFPRPSLNTLILRVSHVPANMNFSSLPCPIHTVPTLFRPHPRLLLGVQRARRTPSADLTRSSVKMSAAQLPCPCLRREARLSPALCTVDWIGQCYRSAESTRSLRLALGPFDGHSNSTARNRDRLF